ncbi:kinase-like protein [Hypoxylon sp. FL0890]|nr:kinase-like protein [Hypoxylon sp. FL0890]
MPSFGRIFGEGSLALRRAFNLFLPSRQIRTFENVWEEDLARYCPGGYHPVRIGDEFHSGRYKVVTKLGYGIYSTVWLARNLQNGGHVALKILTADAYDGKKDTFELDILRCMASKTTQSPDIEPGSDRILGLLDEFQHSGPNGKHVCLVFMPMGPNLSIYRRLFPKLRIPIPVAKNIARQLLQALAFLHDTCHIIHTDIKPQNVLIKTQEINEMFDRAPSEVFLQQSPPVNPPENFYMQSEPVSSGEEDLSKTIGISVKLADFGVASWFDKHLTEWIQPQMLRAPEVILNAGWNHKVDIWNLGLIIWELVQGQLCFDGQATATAPYSSEAHLAQMTAILGSFPVSLLERSQSRDKFFDSQGHLLSEIHFPPVSLKSLNAGNGTLEGQEADDFVDFIQETIALEPERRPDARQLLQARWLQDV